jgi:thiol-disulfide isomerase/thioredoxin
MLITVLRSAILMAAMLSGCLQAGTLDDIRALEAGKTGRSAPAMDALSLPENRAATTTDRAAQNTSPVWYSLNDGRKVNLQDWKVVLFMQSTCQYCRQFAPVLKAFLSKPVLTFSYQP